MRIDICHRYYSVGTFPSCKNNNCLGKQNFVTSVTVVNGKLGEI